MSSIQGSGKILYSVVIPAFNEAEHITACVASIRKAMQASPGAGEIIVVDNDSTDDTAAIAARAGCRVVHEPFRQIARARNSGARAAAGRYLIFVDADTLVDERLIGEVLLLLESGKVAGGGARIEFAAQTSFFANMLLRFWQTVSKAARLAAGCFIFCTADAFAAAGGFDERIFAGEELGFSRRIRAYAAKFGKKMLIIDRPWVKTSTRKNQQPGRILLTMIIFAVFPFAVRFRAFCFHWYDCR